MVSLDGVGSEQRNTRPAIIVQNDVGNAHSPTTVIVPLSTKIKPSMATTHVKITSEQGVRDESEKLLKYSYDTVIPRIVRRLSVVRWLSYHAEAREQLNNSHNRPCACKAKHVHKIKQYCYKHNNISLEVSIVRLGARGERYARHELNNIRRLRHTHLSRYRVSVRLRLTPNLLKCILSVFRAISIECIMLGRSVRIGSDNQC